MAPPPLSQELIDEIIDQCSSDKRTLASLSMVARAWRRRSQKHLFSVIDFRMPSSMGVTEADLDGFDSVLSLTRDLNIDECWEIFSQLDPATIALLHRFRNLESLFLTNWYSRWLSTEQLSTCFRHFGETVIDLKLEGGASSESLIYIVSMFPRLQILQIFTVVGHDEEIGGVISKEGLPALGNFQGYLFLCGLSEQHNDFLDFLSSTSPKFDAICIDSCETGDGVGKLLESSAATLELLDLYIDDDSLGANPTSLSECSRLREISICHPYPESIPPLLQTIRSPHLQKFVVFFESWCCERLVRAEGVDMWTRTDNELSEAYDRWAKHVTGTIEVIFDVRKVKRSLEGCQEGLKRCFPRFTEKVTITITC